jgi:DNA-binding CsgD family transcriptional regulator
MSRGHQVGWPMRAAPARRDPERVDEMLPAPSAQRAADADRAVTADALAEHFAAGRLTVEEHARRTDAAYEAATLGELSALTADLPPGRVDARRALRESAAWRAHVTVFAVVSVLGVGLWALTTDLTPRTIDDGAGYYWPLWLVLVGAVVVAGHGLRAAGVVGRRADARPVAAPVPPAVPDLDGLTGRERDVMAQLARGRSNKEIAAALGITERTPRTHVSNILLKLGLRSRTEAALLAARDTPDAGATRGATPS